MDMDMDMDSNSISLIISIILVPISVHLSWYYNRIRKIKLIYNNFICINNSKTDNICVEISQEYLNMLMNEFDMEDKSNKFVKNIQNQRNMYRYEKNNYSESKKYDDLCKLLYTDIINCLKIVNEKQKNFNENKISDCEFKKYFNCNPNPIYGNSETSFDNIIEKGNNRIIKNSKEICDDINKFRDDKKFQLIYWNLCQHNSINKNEELINIIKENNYYNNVVFLHFPIILDKIKELQDIFHMYDEYEKQIEKLKKEISNKKISIYSVIKYDVDRIYKKHKFKIISFISISTYFSIIIKYLPNILKYLSTITF